MIEISLVQVLTPAPTFAVDNLEKEVAVAQGRPQVSQKGRPSVRPGESVRAPSPATGVVVVIVCVILSSLAISFQSKLRLWSWTDSQSDHEWPRVRATGRRGNLLFAPCFYDTTPEVGPGFLWRPQLPQPRIKLDTRAASSLQPVAVTQTCERSWRISQIGPRSRERQTERNANLIHMIHSRRRRQSMTSEKNIARESSWSCLAAPTAPNHYLIRSSSIF